MSVDFISTFKHEHFKGRLPTLLLVQIHLGMFDQTSDDLLEVLLLGRVPVPLAELDGREESGVVVIVLEKKSKLKKQSQT